MGRPDWGRTAEDTVTRKVDRSAPFAEYRKANAGMIERTVKGQGPHSTSQARGGIRLVYNMSTAHIPAFMAARPGAPAYLNRYDLKKRNARPARLGKKPPQTADLRERIDDAVAEVGWPGESDVPADLYYGAVELNGAGIRYFGDACLVLRFDKVPAQTLVLYRNSYDLSCEPVVDRVYVRGDRTATKKKAVAELGNWSGRWPEDVPQMLVCKILEGAPDSTRRMTTGAVSEGVLSDEDYVEVPKRGSFAAGDLEECRFTSADAAAEARIADRLRNGPSPSFSELQWRHRRRVAEAALGIGPVRVPVRVVVSPGRDRG